MTRSEAVKAFFVKSVLPVAAVLLLYCIFKSACMKGGELDYVCSGYSAACPSASIGCASGSYQAAVPSGAGLRCSR